MSGAWLRKKVRHPWLGGACRLTMYLATLDCATSNPSLSNSPWIGRSPKRVLDAHPPDQRAKVRLDLRPPSPWARFPTPITAKAGPMPPHERPRLNDHDDLQDRWKPSIQLDKEPAIMVGEPDATMQPAPQDNQLMSKHRVLGFKPQLRLEWRG